MLVAITAPFFWTFQCFMLRQCAERGDFNLFDLAIDQTMFINATALCIFISYATSLTPNEEFDWRAFGFGQLVGVLFFAGGIFSFLAYKTGPGGPINTLISIQIPVQTIINAFVYNQALTNQEIIGVSIGILSALFISMGDYFIESLRGKKEQAGIKDTQVNTQERLITETSTV